MSELRPRPLNDPDRARDERRWGTPVEIQAGERLANTVLREGRTFYPVFTRRGEGALGLYGVGYVVTRLLEQAGCSVTRPHVLRHTIASIAINDWLLSVRDVCEAFHWETEALVWKRYAKGQAESVFAKFDALTDREFAASGKAGAIVHETATALGALLAEYASRPAEESSFVPVWNAIVGAMDLMSSVDPEVRKPSESVLLGPDEVARIDAFIRKRSDRHESLEGIIGRALWPGLQMPRLYLGGDDDTDAAPVAA